MPDELTELEFLIDKVRSLYLKGTFPYRLADEAERTLVGEVYTPKSAESQAVETKEK